jgi:hypothetical protein
VPLAIRKIRGQKWSPRYSWLPEGDLEADAIQDLKTENNTISLFVIEDNRSNFDRVLAALAANCTNIANFDYALIDLDALKDSGYKFTEDPGETADKDVNKWHLNMIELSLKKLTQLAFTLVNRGEIDRKDKPYVKRCLEASVRENKLDSQLVKLEDKDRALLGLPPLPPKSK